MQRVSLRAGLHLRPRKVCVSLAFLALVALAGCGSSSRRSEPVDVDLSPTTEAPSWRFQPLSWDKLEAIESWLAREGAQADPALRLEAELQMAEGWLTFTREDQTAGSVPAESLRVRLANARDVFQRIGADPAASPGQRARAQIGLQGTQALFDAPTAVGLSIVPRARWGARPPRTDRLTPLRGTWSRLTVHHSAETVHEQRGGTLDDSAQTLRAIQRYHMEDPSHRYGDIGYHYLIDSSGRIFEGRPLAWQGAHAGGRDGINNNQNVGICVLGDFLASSPSPAAMKSLELLVSSLRATYRIPPSRVFAHSDFKSTECPGSYLERWVRAQR